MSDKIYLGLRASSLNEAPQFAPYSRVVLEVTDELYYTAGNDTGRTLTLQCPFGTQAMCNNILSEVRGYRYQPYEAADALLDAAAELGDGVSVGSVYGGLFARAETFGRQVTANISAPADEEVDHEYPYKPPSERKVTRQLNSFKSELSVQADEISARVEKSGGNAQSFGWSLQSSGWTLSANGAPVFKVTASGAEIVGKITATSGSIDGALIVGTLHAEHIEAGTITATQIASETITADEVESDTLTTRTIAAQAITTSCTSNGINTSLGYADFANSAFNGIATVNSFYTNFLSVEAINGLSINTAAGQRQVVVREITIGGTVYALLGV